jgi:hypothetical protein
MTEKRRIDSPARGQKKTVKTQGLEKELIDWKMLNLPIINPLPNERLEANLRKMHLEGLLAKP